VADREPTWQPLAAVPTLTAHIRQGVTLAREQLALLARAQERPYLLDDATVNRLRAAFENTRDDTELFAEQGRRWQAAAADPATRAAVDGYVALVAQERALVDQVLTVADELAAGTIEKTLAKSDLELGLEALFGRRP
jgi:hypothetical protein